MRIFAIPAVLALALSFVACGGSPSVTIVNEAEETVSVEIKGAGDAVFTFSDILPGAESDGPIGLGPMDVKAVFPNGVEPTTGFRSEEGGEYRLIIRGTPPGIFLQRE